MNLSPAVQRQVKGLPGAIVAALFLFYLVAVNHTEPTEIGVARDIISGDMWLQEGGGYHFTPPWVLVSCIDLRPMRLSVPTSGRAVSAKLVQFKKEGWRDFVQTEGWEYWWWANRFSFNSGYKEECRGMRDILRGYAFSPKEYPFLETLKEYDVD